MNVNSLSCKNAGLCFTPPCRGWGQCVREVPFSPSAHTHSSVEASGALRPADTPPHTGTAGQRQTAEELRKESPAGTKTSLQTNLCKRCCRVLTCMHTSLWPSACPLWPWFLLLTTEGVPFELGVQDQRSRGGAMLAIHPKPPPCPREVSEKHFMKRTKSLVTNKISFQTGFYYSQYISLYGCVTFSVLLDI